jgi:hypothetical protein
MIKIYDDRKGAADFDAALNNAVQRCNELIDIWHEFQPFARCSDVATFEQIAAAPGQMFDQLLIDNVQMTANAGLKPSPQQVALLYDIDRMNFYNLVEGKPIKENCAPCQRAKVKPGKQAISLAEYRRYAPYMIFSEGEFIVDTAAAADYKKKFEIYATTPAQVAVVEHYDNLVQLLNKHCADYPINNSDKERIAVALNLQLSKGITGDFITNSEYVKNLITAQ